MDKKIVLTTIIIVIFGAGAYWFLSDRGQGTVGPINSFDECKNAGYPIAESYPERCVGPNGKTFVRQIADNPVDNMSGIRGTVMLGPSCPVSSPTNPNCTDKPYQEKLSVTTPDGAQIFLDFRTNENGTFNVTVPPGKYAIRSAEAANVLPYCASEGTIVVKAKVYTEIVIHCDSGIR